MDIWFVVRVVLCLVVGIGIVLCASHRGMSREYLELLCRREESDGK